MEMDFKFLYDDRRKLFSIGYQVGANTVDNSYYDLLASESRLASFIAIAKDDVSVDHWFRLGRTLTGDASARTLLSWSGSMFEYLMPALVMQTFPFTLLDQTHKARSGSRSRMERSGEFRGESQNRRTTCATGRTCISTAALAFPISRSSAG